RQASHGRRLGMVAITDFGRAAQRAGRRIDQPVRFTRRQRTASQLFLPADDDAARIAFEPHDVTRVAQRHAGALALPDGVAFDSLVAADHLAVGGDELARQIDLAPAPADEGRIIAVGHEADFLAVLLVGHAQPEAPGDFADLLFL